MNSPLKINDYELYVVQIGTWEPVPDISFAVFAQDILAKNKKEGLFLMKFLYPQSLGVGLPFLCPIVEIISEDFHEENVLHLSYPN